MKKELMITLQLLLVLFIIIPGLLFVFQEKLIFYPQKLNKNYQFSFDQKFEEINVRTIDGITLNGILFKADSSKGLIFYLHGNAGSLSSWGEVAGTYTDLNYDIFMLDYRGYGKSEGSISGEGQLFQDMQTAYDELKNKYNEDSIIVLGYSLGAGLAAKIASTNNPKLLILQAPYYSMTDMMRHTFPVIPTFILKYKLKTNEFIKHCKMPIVIFHGNQDEVIYYNSSLKLKELFKESDTLITLNGQGHNGMSDNRDYILEIQKILTRE
jgi:alpha-beta hydrolase superfamily lysophospholipase